MADLVLWVVAALCGIAGVALGRLWGGGEGRRAAARELEAEARRDVAERMARGRAAVLDGRDVGDPAERLRRNDGRW